jgi:hypothetical protein
MMRLHATRDVSDRGRMEKVIAAGGCFGRALTGEVVWIIGAASGGEP